jgi:PAS domain S-box-containing protein
VRIRGVGRAVISGFMSAFEALVDQAPDGVVILEAGRVVYINETAAQLLGVSRDAALGRPIASFLPPADAALAGQRIGRLMATGDEVTPADYGTLADPSRVVEIKAKRWQWDGRLAVLAFARDVTERRALARQLEHADRLAAIGTLAAGVAHEINNPLAYVQLSLQLMEAQLAGIPGATEAVGQLVSDATQGVDRVAAIVRGLRAFARPSLKDAAAAATPLDIAAVVEAALRMVDNDLRHRARLERAFAPVPAAYGHAARLEQVVVNLLLNAIQALTGSANDTITVELAPRGTTEVTITVRDTGSGMSPDIRARIFDPFFTTKAVGEGMGLGLSVSRNLVEAMGGRIEVDTELGRGTAMTIVLRADRTSQPAAPAGPPPLTIADGAIDLANVTASATSPVTEPRGRVLIIDDEPLVRSLLAELLAPHCDAIAVGSGTAALAELASNEFDVILCDVMMPGLSGVDVYRHLAATRPGLERRFVFITGGAFTADVESFLATCENEVLAKPFQLATVLAAITRARS